MRAKKKRKEVSGFIMFGGNARQIKTALKGYHVT